MPNIYMTEELMTEDDMRQELAQCKEIIDKGLVTSMLVCRAFVRVRDMELFKFDDCVTFQEWATKNYHFSINYVKQLLRNGETLNELPEDRMRLISTERAAMELSKLPKEFILTVVDLASNGGKESVTQESIRRVIPVRPANGGSKKKSKVPPRDDGDEEEKPHITQPTKKEKKNGPVDKTGLEVPQECLELWERGTRDGERAVVRGTVERTAQEMVTLLRIVIANVKGRMDNSDGLFVECDLQQVGAWLNQSIKEIECAIPEYICWQCNGKTPKGCDVCSGPKGRKLQNGRGFVSKHYWNQNCPEEIKTMRGAK
jgi:hypothetical protein